METQTNTTIKPKWIKLNIGEGYIDKNDRYSFARCFKSGLSSKEIKKRGIKRFIFSARIGRDGIEIKEYYPTFKQAELRLLSFVGGKNE